MLKLLCVFLLASSFALAETVSKGRYKGMNPARTRNCFVDIAQRLNDLEVRTSDTPDFLFKISLKDLKHPATDPSYAEVPVNFSDDYYEVYSKDGPGPFKKLRLSFNKVNDVLVPKAYMQTTKVHDEDPIHCFFEKKLND